MDTSSIQNGLTTAKTGIMTLIKFIVDNVAVPIISAGLIGLLVFLIASAVSKHHQGEDYSHKVYLIIGTVIVLGVVVTFPTWGWKMIGQ